MNGRYVTKLLPVEEEIKLGDIVMGINVVCCIFGTKSRHGLPVIDEDNLKKLRDPRKAKMFLCSPEKPTAGDNVYDEVTGKIITLSDLDYKEMLEEGSLGVYLKVIGEISSKAIWVKDGQSILEDEWGVFVRDFFEPSEWVNVSKIQHWNESIIKIKCKNCETFH